MTTALWPDHLLSLEEWDALPEDTSRLSELVEGILLVVPKSAPLHQRVMVRLTDELDRQLPDKLTAVADVEVAVEARHPATVRAPDVVVVPADLADEIPARFKADEVVVAVEIVSPGTGRTDRVTKLFEYAAAGIPHYWIVELDEPITLHAHTLVNGNYEYVDGGKGEIAIPSPAPVVLDLPTLISRR